MSGHHRAITLNRPADAGGQRVVRCVVRRIVALVIVGDPAAKIPVQVAVQFPA